MSSIKSHCADADELLDQCIEAARQQFNAARIEDSAQRIRERLSLARGTSHPSFSSLLKEACQRAVSWTSLAGASLLLFVAILFASYLLPGSNGTVLAQAQQWLMSFRTLQVETTVRDEDEIMDVVVWFDETGDTRIESRGTTTIVKPDEDMIYVLGPDGRSFAQRIASDIAVVESSTGFLDIIRSFQEDGDRLAVSRLINGVSAVGYERTTDKGAIVLWVDRSDGRPLLVESERPDGVTMHSVLNFDVSLPLNAFDVPNDVPILPDDVQLLQPR